MSITNGQQADANDFVDTPAASQSGKVPKLNANGEISAGFLPTQDSEVDQSQTTRNAGTAVGEADATTKKNLLAQSFIPTSRRIRGFKLYKDADTGSFTGTVTIALYADSGGSPTGSALATVTITNAAWLLIATGEFEAEFTTEYASAVIGNLYWLRVSTSTSDNSNHPNLGHNSAGGYGSGSVKYNNTTDGWVAISTIDLYFKILFGTLSQVAKTASDTGQVPAIALPYSFVYMSTATVAKGTSMYTVMLPAGFFRANSGIKVTLMGNQNLGNAGTVETTVKINGTQLLYYVSAGSGGNDVPDANFKFEGWALNQNSLSSQKCLVINTVLTTYNGTSSLSGAVVLENANRPDTAAINLAGLCVLTIDMAVGGGGSANINAVIIEKIG